MEVEKEEEKLVGNITEKDEDMEFESCWGGADSKKFKFQGNLIRYNEATSIYKPITEGWSLELDFDPSNPSLKVKPTSEKYKKEVEELKNLPINKDLKLKLDAEHDSIFFCTEHGYLFYSDRIPRSVSQRLEAEIQDLTFVEEEKSNSEDEKSEPSPDSESSESSLSESDIQFDDIEEKEPPVPKEETKQKQPQEETTEIMGENESLVSSSETAAKSKPTPQPQPAKNFEEKSVRCSEIISEIVDHDHVREEEKFQ